MSRSYKGDVSAEECWSALQSDPQSFLIDVRTSAEWNFVGFPMVPENGQDALFAEWQTYPTMAVDPRFAERVGAARARGRRVGGLQALFPLPLGRPLHVECRGDDGGRIHRLLQRPRRLRGDRPMPTATAARSRDGRRPACPGGRNDRPSYRRPPRPARCRRQNPAPFLPPPAVRLPPRPRMARLPWQHRHATRRRSSIA